MAVFGAVTDVTGIKVGYYTDGRAATGCTATLCEQGAVTGVRIGSDISKC